MILLILKCLWLLPLIGAVDLWRRERLQKISQWVDANQISSKIHHKEASVKLLKECQDTSKTSCFQVSEATPDIVDHRTSGLVTGVRNQVFWWNLAFELVIVNPRWTHGFHYNSCRSTMIHDHPLSSMMIQDNSCWSKITHADPRWSMMMIHNDHQ